MLEIKNITKKYITGDFTQAALDGASLTFRDNEFVAILGPSGSGKTTLLNIVGGLDRYDSGDLIINGTSTRDYSERDWDTYRNHSIGFVFQNYNLIPHQSVLSNVELALSISGVSPDERKRRAEKALEEVGLLAHRDKLPNQLSGGQMQRVAIARALVNDPDILLADEPTGAIDTGTSIQIMELLKNVAKDRLVVMVTHNAELAGRYATRTVRLEDGRVIEDTAPADNETPAKEKKISGSQGPAAMGPLTSLSLSFSNLMTKKGRTLLTSFAGSIGIIGIALILALSNGVSGYIRDIQRDTMISYPISIDARTFDFASIFNEGRPELSTEREVDHDLDGVYADTRELEIASRYATTMTENNLKRFRIYLEDPDNEILPHLGENGIIYSYAPAFSIYAKDPLGRIIDATGDSSDDLDGNSSASRQLRRSMRESMEELSALAPGGQASSSRLFQELLPGRDGSLISRATMESYDLLAGEWPDRHNEILLVLDAANEIPLEALQSLGFLPSREYDRIMDALNDGEPLPPLDYRFDHSDVLGHSLFLLPESLHYKEMPDGRFERTGRPADLALTDAMELRISGILRPKEGAAAADIRSVAAYTGALTEEVIEKTAGSPVVQAQMKDPAVNVLSGLPFITGDVGTKADEVIRYIENLSVQDKADLMRTMAGSFGSLEGMPAEFLWSLDENQLAAMVDDFIKSPDPKILLSVFEDYISVGSFEENMAAFGHVDLSAPSSIRIYADSFDGKDAIASAIARYNTGVPEEDRILYTDLVALMTSSVTDIIGVITYVLIAFVAVSLIVSSIMIGVITYISVVERTKEIGILRALGASRANIAQVFNAETFVIGLFSGVLGVGISYLLTFPVNSLIQRLTGIALVNARLPLLSALMLIGLSILLTMLGGLIPSRKAAGKDPVAALRVE